MVSISRRRDRHRRLGDFGYLFVRTGTLLLTLAVMAASAPAQETPAQETPAQETPAQETPAQEREAAVAGDPGLTPRLHVQADFPGGSGNVEHLDHQARSIRLTPTEHAGRGWACWWWIKVSGLVPGETLTLDVGKAPWATPDRAAFSLDNQTWHQTEPGRRDGERIVYRCRVDASEAWFAWGPPFLPDDAQQLVDWAERQCEEASAWRLCCTREGRHVPALRLTAADDAGRVPYGIWIIARQHAWESGSSWVCKGLVEWLVSSDPRAVRLRSIADINIVPIMDVDSVAIGAGGKNQLPHDHNRDWGEHPHWRAVAAAMRHIQQQNADERFDMFVDLHNPGASTQQPFFYISPRDLLSDAGTRNLEHFLAAARIEMNGPLPFLGTTHQSDASYDQRWKYIAKNWVSLNCRDHVVSVTLETAWNTPSSTTDGYRTVGRQLGQSIERYLRVDPRPAAARAAEGVAE